MGIDRETLAQLRHLFRPLATRIANVAARAVVNYASDATKLQLLQLGVLADETVPDAEHHQAYGFSSVPLSGAEAVVIFPNGDRAHPLVVAVSDRRYRPTGGEAGEVTVYNHTGAKIVMTNDGDIVVTPATGREVMVGGLLGTEPTIKGTTYRAAEDALLGALAGAIAALAAATPTLTGSPAQLTAWATAVTNLAAAATAFFGATATYLTQTAKVK